MYGKELILDIHDCDVSLFNRKDLETFIKRLCVLTDMKREDIHFWDYDDQEKSLLSPHLKGTSVVQFIRTSNIVIHALDDLKKIFLNLFSCKNFDDEEVSMFAAKWLKGRINNQVVVTRS